jgi:hypothetical protein
MATLSYCFGTSQLEIALIRAAHVPAAGARHHDAAPPEGVAAALLDSGVFHLLDSVVFQFIC